MKSELFLPQIILDKTRVRCKRRSPARSRGQFAADKPKRSAKAAVDARDGEIVRRIPQHGVGGIRHPGV